MRKTQSNEELGNGGNSSTSTLENPNNNETTTGDHVNTVNAIDDPEGTNNGRQQPRSVRQRRSGKMVPKMTPKERMRNAWKMLRLRKRWEREYDKNRAVPAPFVAVHVKDKRGSMQASLILMFALMQCICGFVFPICDAFALTDTWTQFAINHKYYLETFLLSQYIGAILVLAYLQTLICYYSEPHDTKNNCNEENPSNRNGEECYTVPERISENEAFEPSPEFNSTNGSPRQRNTAQHNRFHFHCVDRRASWIPFKCFTFNVSERKRISWHEDGMNLYLRLGAVGFGLGVMIHDGFNLSSAWELERPSCHSELWIPKHVLRLIWVLWQTYFVFKYHRLVLQAHKFFVRLAFTHLAAVNLCHWLKVVISEISETLRREGRNASSQASFIAPVTVAPTTTAIWTMLNVTQTGNLTAAADYLNKSATNHVSELQESLHARSLFSYEQRPTRLCEGHLGETLKPFLYPLAIEYSLITGTLFYKMLQRVGDRSSSKLSTYASCNSLWNTRLLSDNYSGTQLHTTPSMISFRELSSPSMLQYPTRTNSTGTMDDTSSVLMTCDKHTSYRQLLGCRVYLPPDIKEEELSALTKDRRPSNRNPAKSVEPNFRSQLQRRGSESYCHRSHTGLFLGLMLLLACTFGVIFTISRGKSTFSKLTPYIYQHSKIFMLSVSMIACLIAISQTYSMKFRRIESTESFEYNLLGIGLIGCLTYHMLLFVPSLETVVHAMIYRSVVEQSDAVQRIQFTINSAQPVSIEKLHGTALLYIIKCTLEVCQALLQFFFIVEASRRGPCCRNQAIIKPGRSAIVFLLITNLALWLMNTFEFRQSEYQLTLHRQYYGINTWSVIQCCFIPLIIFFRFHSTVCLAQIWSKLYVVR